jgi:tryptophan 7-halogenase
VLPGFSATHTGLRARIVHRLGLDEGALEDLLRVTGGKPSAEPRFLRFVSGRRKLFWNRNCIALGLASGFLEPLESTSIHLVASGIYHLLEHFPDTRFDQANIDSYNRELTEGWERIRDFIVLHYCRSQREDSAFWRSCRSLRIPDSLRERIALYEGTGRIRPRQGELFTDLSWFYILDGLGIRAATCDPFVDVIPPTKLSEILASLAGATAALVEAAPTHDSHFANAGR